jgi:hypothetical protein
VCPRIGSTDLDVYRLLTAASSRVVTRVIRRARNPGVSRWWRTSRSTNEAGRAAHVSRASHEGEGKEAPR